MGCDRSRPYWLTLGSGRWKKIHRAVGISDMPLFSGGVIHAHCKPHIPQRVPACNTVGSPNSLIYYMHTRLAGYRDVIHQSSILCMRAHSRLWEQFIGPILKVMGNCLS